ncbi:MAG: hypothetical protein DMF98_05035 [Acidobacteria bacterium]|nr:MAG: hypothetical protein DMF98_05035 [Acidobacteriota bacterium]
MEPASISSVGRRHPCGRTCVQGRQPGSRPRGFGRGVATDRLKTSDEFYWRDIQEAFTLDRELPFKLSDLESD